MRSTFRFPLRASLVPLLFALLVVPAARAQVTPGSLFLSVEGGAGIYFGEFNTFETGGDFQVIPGFDGAVSLKYVFNPYVALNASAGYSNFIHRITDSTRNKYSTSFFGPVGTPTYPGSTVEFTDRNRLEIVRYTLTGQVYLFPESRVVPYLLAGIGLDHFTPRNNNNEQLPTNLTGVYSRQSFIAPLGLGVEFYFSRGFSAFANGVYYFNTTDYLDGFANYLSYSSQSTINGPGTGATNYDYSVALTAGISVALYQPDESMPPPPPDTARRDTATRTPPPTTNTGRTGRTGFPPAGPLRPTPVDRDGDGLTNDEETSRYRTNPNDADTDGDGLNDADELHLSNTSPNSADTDGDGLNDGAEVIVNGSNPLVRDTDGDGISDGDEVNRTLSDPTLSDTDGDGVGDKADACPTVPGTAANNGCP